MPPLNAAAPPEAPLAQDHLAQAIDRLRNTHLFEELGADSLRDLAGACRELACPKGETCVREGEPADGMFVVLSGRLEVVRATPRGEQLLGELRRGEYFGEVALLEGTPRMATVRARTDATLLVLDRGALEAFLEEHPATRETLRAALAYRLAWARTRSLRPPPERVIAALGELTGGLAAEDLAAFEGEVEWLTLPRGSVLMRQGEPGDCLYLVVSGRLKVYGQRDDGAEVLIGEIGPGESVGEMALLSNDPRSASVAALRDCELLRLSRSGFEELVRAHPTTMGVFARHTVERLSRRIRARSIVSQLRANPLATAEECEEITQIENLVMRNLKITQMYYRLSLQLALMLGQQDANWCTFACSASKTAGYSIRRQEIPFAAAMELVKQRPRGRQLLAAGERLLGRAGLRQRMEEVLEAVSLAISAGNLKVFAELAPIFARVTETFHRDTEYDRAKFDAFLATLRPGPTEADGQDLLGEALSHYYEAMFEVAPKRRTELILLGNIKIGLHEQTRLQPNIVEALNAPLAVGLGDGVQRSLAGLARRLPGPLARRATARVDDAEQELLARLTVLFRRVVTRSMMTLRLPYGDVRLGRDVPRLPNEELFPDMLQRLELPELVRIVDLYGADPSGAVGSRASDWGILADRMNFIVDLFRSRQKSLELFDQPFLYEQRLAMAGNSVPGGRL